MEVMHDLPILGHSNPRIINDDVKSRLMFVLDIRSDNTDNESSAYYGPSNIKINEPPKVLSSYKEGGFDYFTPRMKYRGT